MRKKYVNPTILLCIAITAVLLASCAGAFPLSGQSGNVAYGGQGA